MIPAGLRRLFRLDTGRADPTAEVDAELQFHRDSTVAELEAEGLSPADAQAEAERRLASLARARDELVRIDAGRERRARLTDRLAAIGLDLRLAARGLAREPGFTVTVALTLALGIGANTTMMGLVDRLLFRSPPHVVAADRLAQVSLTETHPTYGRSTNTGLAWPDYELAARQPAFASAAAFYTSRLTHGRGQAAERVRVTLSTAGFFPTLGVQPALGRFYTEDEARIGAGDPVVVLSDRFWRRRFGADPAVLGTALPLGAGVYTVIGVAPPGFSGIDLNAVDAWLPLGPGAPEMLGPGAAWAATRNWQWVRVIARLAPGADPTAAATALTGAHAAAVAGDPEVDRDVRFAFGLHGVHPGAGPEAPRATRVASWLAVLSLAVLLLACANVANLLLARGARRRRELAVRLALGAGRARVVRQLLVETGALALLGGGLALLLVQWGGLAIRTFLLPGIDWVGAPLDRRAALLAAAATALTLLVAGLVPALRSSHAPPADGLRSGAGAGGDPGHARLRRGLLVLQTALTVILLLGAGWFGTSLRAAMQLDLGFDPRGLVVVDVDWAERPVGPERRAAMADRLQELLERHPGVRSVTQGIAVPFQTRYSTRLRLPGRDSVPRLATGTPTYSGVSPGFDATLGLRLTRGRSFTAADRAGAAPVVVVNETMARTFWPGGDALGECLFVGSDSTAACSTVVGVVTDSRIEALVEEPTMQYFVPVGQAPALGLSGDRALFLRAAGDADALVEPVRRAILDAAPELSWASVVPMERYLEPHVQPWRLGAGVLAGFGLLALLVAAVGVYGSLAYSVATRSREFGVRGALGAAGPDLVRLVLAEGIRVTAIGLGLGVAIGLALGRVSASLLFETSPGDPLVLAAVAALLLAAAAAASLVPAWRAARVPPAESLRSE